MRSRWLIFLPVAIFALFEPQPAHATQIGLLVRGYSVNEIPPTKSDIAYPLCGTSVEPFINASWDSQPYQQCDWDLFMLHYTGFIQIPEHETIEFFVASDDGGTVKIGAEEFGVWQDQGCSATMSGQLDITAGTQVLDAWMYENAGGTCFMLAWNIDGRGWEIVQPEFFTSEPLPAASTSTLETTTTEAPTTTSTYLPTTTAEPQTTSTSLQTIAPIPPSSLLPETSPPTNTEPTPTTLPELPPETTPTTYLQTTSSSIPVTTIPVLPSVSVSNAPETTTTTYTPPQTDQPLTQEQFAEALTALSEATPEQVTEIVDAILTSEVTSDQAEQLVAAVEVISAITGEQAQQLLEAIEPAQLSESMAAVIADAMNDPAVSDEVKEAFENTLNIFGNDGFATYVPLGSKVNVAVRRTIVAGTTILVALPSPAPVRRK
jgi:hypothetical protein